MWLGMKNGWAHLSKLIFAETLPVGLIYATANDALVIQSNTHKNSSVWNRWVVERAHLEAWGSRQLMDQVDCGF